MILLFNVYLCPSGLNQTYFRGNLPTDDKVNVFKYCLSSLHNIYDWSQVIIKFKLHDVYKHRETELVDYIKNLFNGKNLSISTNRNEYQKDWRETCESLAEDDLIFYSGNHDHIFLDYRTDYFHKCVSDFRDNAGDYGALAITHFPELMAGAEGHRDKFIKECGVLLEHKMATFDSFIILTTKLFKDWWLDEDLGNAFVPRSDYHPVCLDKLKRNPQKPQSLFFSSRELFRHYDGYSTVHNNYGYSKTYTALTIPKGFFENQIRIKYNHPEYDPEFVNISPHYSYDYNLTKKEIPIAWQGKIIEFQGEERLSDLGARLSILDFYIGSSCKGDRFEFFSNQNKKFLESRN